jgi:hypothetical protein
MHRAILGLLLLISTAAGAESLEEMRTKAMAGDYQAQRNLAFSLAKGWGTEIKQNPMLGCAWYKVILLSGSEQVHEGDIGNVQVYCGRLTAEQQAMAEAQAQALAAKIYKRN